MILVSSALRKIGAIQRLRAHPAVPFAPYRKGPPHLPKLSDTCIGRGIKIKRRRVRLPRCESFMLDNHDASSRYSSRLAYGHEEKICFP